MLWIEAIQVIDTTVTTKINLSILLDERSPALFEKVSKNSIMALPTVSKMMLLYQGFLSVVLIIESIRYGYTWFLGYYTGTNMGRAE